MLVELADRVRASIEDELQAAAAGIDRSRDWRLVVEETFAAHPATPGDTVAAYQRECDRAAEFLRARDLVALPDAGLTVVEAGNLALRQNFPLALYLDGKRAVTTAPGLEADPAYLANHCAVCIPPLAVHEGYPGHHVQFWHLERSGAEPPPPPLDAEGPATRRNHFYIEGWALYAELLMIEQGYYRTPAELLGAWRSILHRAVRAAIDAELHTGVIDENTARERYRTELSLTADAAATEVRRHLSLPASKASYLVGMLQILELRRLVCVRPEPPSPRRFHDALLARAAPYPQIGREVFGVELAAPELWSEEWRAALSPRER